MAGSMGQTMAGRQPGVTRGRGLTLRTLGLGALASLTLVLAALSPSAPTLGSAPEEADAAQFGLVTFEGQQGPRTRQAYKARTNEDWERLWSLVDRKPPRPLQEGSETGIGFFSGELPTGGYAIEASVAGHTAERLDVKIDILPPVGVATQGLTAPYMFLIVGAVSEEAILNNAVRLQVPPPFDDAVMSNAN